MHIAKTLIRPHSAQLVVLQSVLVNPVEDFTFDTNRFYVRYYKLVI